MAKKKLQQRFLAGSSGDLEIKDAKGSKLLGPHGKRYIDFTSGWNVGNLGWGIKEIKDVIKNFGEPTYISPNYHYQPWEDLAAALAEIAPKNLRKVYRATGGTEALEIAMQLAMAYTKRKKFISIEGCYHGNSIATKNLANPNNSSTDFLQIDAPLNKGKLKKLENLLKEKEVAAFIMEPIMCNNGALVPAKEFMQDLKKLCKYYGTLLIIDEVATGFGRTGKIFACEHFDLEPDILCLAKAITGGYAPMGATMTSAKIADSVDEEYYSTYGWHPLSVAVALAYLDYFNKHKEIILANTNKISSLIKKWALNMGFGDKFQGKGLALSIDVGDAHYASTIKKQCLEAGLLIAAQESKLMFFPPLNIDKQTAIEGLNILEQCFENIPKRKSA